MERLQAPLQPLDLVLCILELRGQLVHLTLQFLDSAVGGHPARVSMVVSLQLAVLAGFPQAVHGFLEGPYFFEHLLHAAELPRELEGQRGQGELEGALAPLALPAALQPRRAGGMGARILQPLSQVVHLPCSAGSEDHGAQPEPARKPHP